MKTLKELRKILRRLDTIADRNEGAGLEEPSFVLNQAAQLVDDLIQSLKGL